MMSLTELALGRVAPSLLADNEQVKQRGLKAVNDYRSRRGYRPLAELPKGLPDSSYETCVIGRCMSDMPNQEDRAYELTLNSRNARALELRFERNQLPELIDHSGLPPVLRYQDAHEHTLAR
jgi:hypothetical protein